MMNAYSIAEEKQKEQSNTIARLREKQRDCISLYTQILSAQSHLLDSERKGTSSRSEMITRTLLRRKLESKRANSSKASRHSIIMSGRTKAMTDQ